MTVRAHLLLIGARGPGSGHRSLRQSHLNLAIDTRSRGARVCLLGVMSKLVRVDDKNYWAPILFDTFYDTAQVWVTRSFRTHLSRAERCRRSDRSSTLTAGEQGRTTPLSKGGPGVGQDLLQTSSSTTKT